MEEKICTKANGAQIITATATGVIALGFVFVAVSVITLVKKSASAMKGLMGGFPTSEEEPNNDSSNQ